MSGTAHLVRLVAGALGRAVVASLSLALLIGTGYGWTVQRTLTDRVVTSDVIGSRTTAPEPEQPFTALLVGLDSRTDATGNPLPPELLAELRAGTDEGQLHTDTIILLHVPGGPRARAVAISIPRDSFVTLADGSGPHKINSAYGRATEVEGRARGAGVSGAELDRRSRDAGPPRAGRDRREVHPDPGRPLRGDQPGGLRRDDRRGRRRSGVPAAARARGPFRGRPPRRSAGRRRVRRARLRPAAPGPRGRRPRPHRPSAGVPRRYGEPDAVDRDAVRPGRGPPAHRRRHPARRARPRMGPGPADHPVRPDVGRRHPVRHDPDRHRRRSTPRSTGSP